MKRHRGLFPGLGFAALIAMAAPEAHAGPVTITISFGANTVSFDFTNMGTYAAPGSTTNALNANISVLNSFLASNGSAFAFVNLGGSSNNPGAANPTGSNIVETGQLQVVNPGGNTSISIKVSQDFFTLPNGTATISSGSSVTFTNANVGASDKSSSALDGSSTTPLTYTYNGLANPEPFIGANSRSGLFAPASGYTLSNTAVITAAKAGSKVQFSISASVNAIPVPEPSGLIIMVTGMPLPLAVMGLLRRRRAAA